MPVILIIPMLFLAAGSGGPNELLHYVQTDFYWKSRKMQPSVELLLAYVQPPREAKDIAALIEQLGHEEFAQREAAGRLIAAQGPGVIEQLKAALTSKDPEVADRAARLIKQLSGAGMDPLVHKLMVIRTLGEKKAKEAIEPLKALCESKEPFVADYARRALAKIEGKPAPDLMVPVETMEKDLWLLPKGCKMVGQQRFVGGKVFDWDAWFNHWGMFASLLDRQRSKDDLIAVLQQQVLDWLAAFGNVRIDGVTLAVDDTTLSGDEGFVIVLLRGQYDRQRFAAFFKNKGKAVHQLEGLDVWHVENNAGMILHSDQQLVLMTSASEKKLPLKDLAAALRTGKGTLVDDVEMKALIESTDRTGEGWAAALITDRYRAGYDVLKPFTRIKATRRRDGNRILMSATLTGSDAAAVKASIDVMDKQWKESLASMRQGFAAPKPILKLAESVTLAAEGPVATIFAEAEGDDDSLPGGLVGLLLFSQLRVE